MSKVITFSRTYPKWHPRADEPTYFVEKLWAWLADNTDYMQGSIDMDWHEYYNCQTPKRHTIRSGNRWKAGDTFSPRVWGDNINPKTGRAGAYHSKQIILSHDIELKKVWDIKIEGYHIWIDKILFAQFKHNNQVNYLAHNDGLSLQDFWDWFPTTRSKPIFTGQILCWDEKVNY